MATACRADVDDRCVGPASWVPTADDTDPVPLQPRAARHPPVFSITTVATG